MAAHRIHLRGPWDYVWTPKSGDSASSRITNATVSMPQEWRALFGEDQGTAQFRRKFHRPTNIDPHERVRIVFTEVRGIGHVRLNELPIGEFNANGELIEFDITPSMKPFNELCVEISFDPGSYEELPGGIFGVAALEIRTE